MPTRTKRVDDVATLRALAHPLRMRLLAALRLDGPATASALGRRFAETSGATSYHLRQLARYGFVVEDEEQPSRRERRWRAAHEATAWDTAAFLDDAAGRSAVRVFERQRLDTQVRMLQRWYAERGGWPRAWASAAVDTDLMVRLHVEDLAALSRDLHAVVQRYADAERPADDPEAVRVAVLLQAFPAREVEL